MPPRYLYPSDVITLHLLLPLSPPTILLSPDSPSITPPLPPLRNLVRDPLSPDTLWLTLSSKIIVTSPCFASPQALSAFISRDNRELAGFVEWPRLWREDVHVLRQYDGAWISIGQGNWESGWAEVLAEVEERGQVLIVPAGGSGGQDVKERLKRMVKTARGIDGCKKGRDGIALEWRWDPEEFSRVRRSAVGGSDSLTLPRTFRGRGAS